MILAVFASIVFPHGVKHRKVASSIYFRELKTGLLLRMMPLIEAYGDGQKEIESRV